MSTQITQPIIQFEHRDTAIYSRAIATDPPIASITYHQSSRYRQRVLCTLIGLFMALGLTFLLHTPAQAEELVWTPQDSERTENLYRVTCPSATHCFAIYSSGRGSGVLATTDGGATWNAQSPGGGSSSDLSCPSTTHCFYASDDSIRATTNGGATWSQQTISGFPSGARIYGIDCPSTTHCFLTASHTMNMGGFDMTTPYIYATTNGGDSWSRQTLPSLTNHLIFNVSCVSNNDCFSITSFRNILTTTDGGTTTWSSSLQADDSGTIYCVSTTKCFLRTTNRGQIHVTTDGGANWSALTVDTAEDLNAISCLSDTHCFVVGDAGTIFSTTDDGSTWTTQTSGTTEDLRAISCLSTTHCFAVGDNGTILVSGPAPHQRRQLHQPHQRLMDRAIPTLGQRLLVAQLCVP